MRSPILLMKLIRFSTASGALRDIGENVKAGDLGGFVEGEHNLETELSDSAWDLR